ncbi:hypothetical protein K9U39_19490 [Rhodoblastus acidophilus]|uniref:Uncharacterized protein n=1 Tax=Candidatus Rhodoblastus alkanivorans TaxID=2954117 RepID=A0ABS9Z303_9HYPH|nr:hypothetical protein [Candidatus Rhodoblastus alkanivorans]MCI4677304.1 hypothetical protein [Candidatus Rhodoblastus alkanivorans]MCI4682039.1 hypothetical protein [Candidatus Rhodoblastus alkanivorans]MDI4643090.1 hypothetical protein [Rhodoblastus acidophilus]
MAKNRGIGSAFSVEFSGGLGNWLVEGEQERGDLSGASEAIGSIFICSNLNCKKRLITRAKAKKCDVENFPNWILVLQNATPEV